MANIYNVLGMAESGQNPTIVNPSSTSSGNAAGYYQITSGTWSDFAPRAGVSLTQYPTADAAPLSVQTSVANNIPLSRWATYSTLSAQFPGINDSMTLGQAANLTASDPGQIQVSAVTPGIGPDTSGQGYGSQGDFYINPSGSTASPNVGAGSSASGNPASTAAGAADVGFFPGIYGGPEETGLSPGAAATVSGIGTNIGSAVTGAGTGIAGAITGVGTTFKNFFTGWIGSLENWVGRGFLILIGLVILAIALWRIVDPDGSKTQAIARNMEVAA